MIVTGKYDHAVLISMGAERVADTAEGVQEITPDIDLTGYQEKAAAYFAKRDALAKIKALEAQHTPRLMREAHLGYPEALDKLRNIDNEIAALRQHLSNGS